MTKQAESRLQLLEIIACDCPFVALDHADLGHALRHNPPCKHVLSADHTIPFPDWAGEISHHGGAEYLDADPAPEPTNALPQTAGRISIMAWRRVHGYQLYHPDDATYEQATRLARQGKRLRNGGDVRLGVISVDEVEALRRTMLVEAVERAKLRRPA